MTDPGDPIAGTAGDDVDEAIELMHRIEAAADDTVELVPPPG